VTATNATSNGGYALPATISIGSSIAGTNTEIGPLTKTVRQSSPVRPATHGQCADG